MQQHTAAENCDLLCLDISICACKSSDGISFVSFPHGDSRQFITDSDLYYCSESLN